MNEKPVFKSLQSYSWKDVEAQVSSYWKSAKVPERLSSHRVGKKKFFLLDGPPYVNALPHVGHVKTTTYKDVWTRLRYMQGFDCHVQPGFDTHGLPVEVIVEKELGLTSKRDIVEKGIDKFDAACFEKIADNEKHWLSYYKRLGAWRGFFEPYFTYKKAYVESAWWTFKQLHERGFVARGMRSIHWCPHCETALSGYEVSDSYKMMTDPSIFIKFKVKGTKNEYLLVWTTTPWTLPANVAIAVAPKEKYVKAETMVDGEKQVFILGKSRAKPLLEEKLGLSYKILSEFSGTELDGLEYEPIIDSESQHQLDSQPQARKVYLSISIMVRKKYKKHVKSEETGSVTGKDEGAEFEEFVTLAEGTGLVHCAPGHGLTDNMFGKHHHLPELSPVDEQGKFTCDVSMWQGRFVKSADKEIIPYLEERGSLLLAEKVTHSYPLCWRCKTPLVFRLSEQIYLSVEPIREEMLSDNEDTNWMPEFGREAFGNWVAAANDWCISQQRFWGIPIPLWKCVDCGASHVVENAAELETASGKKLDDLHRHVVDSIVLPCKACGGESRRIPDIFNVWFDSGIAPWASLGYPRHNKELFESMFPVDLVNESQDQVRGWFYVLSFLSHAVFDKPAFNSLALMGWVVDEKGEKMSKSKGNGVTATQALDELGSDALRLYYCWEIAPWDVQKFSFKTAQEAVRALNIYWNSYKFFETYSQGATVLQKLPVLKAKEDEWILSRLNSTAAKAAGHFEAFEFHLAGRTIVEFIVNDYSRWYVKLVRDRVAVDADGKDKEACLAVMRHVILESARLLAPITPYISEYVGGLLEDKDSIHFENYPVADEKRISEKLEGDMALVMALTEAANSVRQLSNTKLRWPLEEMTVVGEKKLAPAIEAFEQILVSQNNVLAVKFSDKEPVGAGYASAQTASGVKVFLKVERSAELVREGSLRELVRAVQSSRKKNGFIVQERIALTVSAEDKNFAKFLEANKARLASEVGASSVAIGKLAGEFEADSPEAKAKAKYARA
ncbi:isoleucine--tRNA ligase [Candidatus Micrarchaeota archaeon CG1_02_55_22]|nr:MAG: isoleucine--tRNA ligase [Candidatus Micrarchaeota archaeon CG1_02_55_22]